MMNKWFNLILASAMIIAPIAQSHAKVGSLTLYYSDGSAPTQGVKNVNAVLKTVGVRVSTVAIPKAAKPILEISKNRAITKEEADSLISHFSLHRGELLDLIKQAGRVPESHRGGFLSSSEIGVSSYPKI